MKLLETLKTEKLYAQGVSSVPLYLMACARSGFLMEQDLGYGFRFFCHAYKQAYGEILYPVSELNRLWEIIREKIKSDPKYLLEVKAKYEEKLVPGKSLFAKLLETDLRGLSDSDLLDLFRQCIEAQTATVGLGHVIEPVGFGLDEEFKKRLFQVLKDKKSFNAAYTSLTKPSQKSFLSKEQEDLEGLLDLQGEELDQAIAEHLKRYYWLLCNYAGLRRLTKENILERLDIVRNSGAKAKNSEEAAVEVELDEETKRIASMLDYTAVWQDERKLKIMQAIYHLGCVVEEIARRTDVSAECINYLEPTEALALKSLEDIKTLAPELAKRVDGVFFLQLPEGPDIATSDGYKAAVAQYEETSHGATKPASSAIYGSVANTGTAIGPVAICRDLASIDKVKQGDILVASMTRPEYMAAIKKAAAIVTDEGGITCHAAIVARELGIPCVIGTKVATKVFKDGDMVEVRANHGMIKKI